jgi:tripartite-type tricarboxylate transporter receptor subunit TctC
VRAGTVKALAVTTRSRSKALPDVPTLAEAGVPDFDVSAFYGLAAPAGVPADVLARVERALEAVVRDAEIVAAMERSGASVDFTGARATAEFMARDGANWKRVVEVARIKLD